MSITELDVSRLPSSRLYGPPDRQVELAGTVGELEDTFAMWGDTGLISPRESFGFAMADPQLTLAELGPLWDQPYDFVWLAAGYGDDKDKLIANVVRKMRWMLRCGMTNTLEMEIWRMATQNPVESVTDGKFLWGDFPYGGAAATRFATYNFIGGVSTFTREEDHKAFLTVSGHLGEKMLQADGLLPSR